MKQQPVRDEDGFALIAVLGFLFVVALFVTPFVLQARTSFFLAANNAKLGKLGFLAEGLMQVALMRHEGVLADGGVANGTAMTCSTDELLIALSVQDHRGLIDLNASGTTLLAAGFRSLGRTETEAKKLAESVVFHRSVRRNSAATTIYEMRGGQRHRKFVSAIELTDLVVDPPLQDWKLTSIFTVHTKSGRLFSLVAAPDLALLFSENGAAGLPLDKRIPVAFAAVSVEVSVSDKRRGLVKTLNRVFVRGQGPDRGFQSMESLPSKTTIDRRPSQNSKPQSCDQIFGKIVATDLNEFKI